MNVQEEEGRDPIIQGRVQQSTYFFDRMFQRIKRATRPTNPPLPRVVISDVRLSTTVMPGNISAPKTTSVTTAKAAKPIKSWVRLEKKPPMNLNTLSMV